MVVVGVILILIGALGILAGLFGTDTEAVSSGGRSEVHATFLGIEMSATAVFLLGVACAVLVLSGLWCTKVGAKQNWRRHQERKRLEELSGKLENVEYDRRRQADDGA
ncbi:hypothetical protein JK386_14710 [Nocardioides sp. zg-536]|uniref:Uncharacterized protein n=1 Tax=Nocardioides faecalis TaxID=2803858 RepID=A0A938YBW4_9ACTN|nr:hypothetical protein [Nocardioides faecalis]MBM9461151.1 hypothetical protein [Nocardioides faecalis]MBS4752195.1 hypothetical protein [Nocardioides faecalis]QVI59004.1 hypothetical protein KG111_00965 [Nocardioides faecalis]